ncbi:MAG: 2-dehydropantoate 2-reductase [Ignavibacteriales bacterium]|nr:2-dehydropantoate 2-reductase [Ignavibacteriales bacterium]
MKFLILGTGGVGGYFGAELARAGVDVWFVARGKHLEHMLSAGLKVRTTHGDFTIPPGKMSEDPAKAGPVDVVLFCVKSYDTEESAAALNPVLHETSVVISLQNGIDNEEKILRSIRQGVVFGGAAYISARISAPGEITETGGLQRIVFGPMNGMANNRAKEILDVLAKARINASLNPNILQELWRKFTFITSMGSMTALSRLTQGEILASMETMDTVFAAMKEVEAVGRAKGVMIQSLEPEKVIEGIRRFDSNTRSSLYYDLINGKPMEIEALNGTVVRFGNDYDVPTPIHDTIYSALLPHHLKHLQNLSNQ